MPDKSLDAKQTGQGTCRCPVMLDCIFTILSNIACLDPVETGFLHIL